VPPRLTAVICTYSRYHVLRDAIASLQAQQLNHGLIEIIVVDNSADQAAAAAFGAAYAAAPNFRYICEPVVGLSNARNIGIAQATAPVVAFIDDDAVAGAGWAQAALDGFAAFGPQAGAVGGPVRPRWGCARPAWLGDDLLSSLALIDWGASLHETLPSRGIVGCNMALDRALALALGGFSGKLGRSGPELTLLSNEESALFKRIQEAGRAIVYAPAAAVEHVIDPSRLTQTWFRRRAAWQAVSDFMMEPGAYSAYAAGTAKRLKAAGPEAGEPDSAAAFSASFWVTYYATITALAGGALPLAPTPGWGLRWRAAVLKGRLFSLTQQQPQMARLGRLGLRSYRRLTGR
jgi:hypothetical protein